MTKFDPSIVSVRRLVGPEAVLLFMSNLEGQRDVRNMLLRIASQLGSFHRDEEERSAAVVLEGTERLVIEYDDVCNGEVFN